MDDRDHANGGGGPTGGVSQANSAGHAPGREAGVPLEIKDAVSALGSKLNEDLQALSIQIGNADQMFERWDRHVQQQVLTFQQQAETIQRDLKVVQNVVRGLPQQIQTAKQEHEALLQAVKRECEAQLQALKVQAEAQWQGLDQRVQADAKLLARIGEQSAATARAMEEKVGQISKLEYSVVGLIRDIGRVGNNETAITDLAKKNAELLAVIDELRHSGRTSNRLSLLNSAAAVILAGLVGLQILGGWPVVASYVALLMPPRI